MILNRLAPAIRCSRLLPLALLLTGCMGNFTYVKEEPEQQQTELIPSLPVPAAPATGAIFRVSAPTLLFEDQKARRVGDLLTVVLAESTNASKTASTSTSKGTDIALATPTLFGHGLSFGGKDLLSAEVDAERSFTGEGDSSQSNTLRGNIAVTVVGVHANGNLIIKGDKLLTLNQGSEVISVSGVVRPIDIGPNNTIRSTEIANVRITYNGTGLLADSNRAGWLTRFFHSDWWPL